MEQKKQSPQPTDNKEAEIRRNLEEMNYPAKDDILNNEEKSGTDPDNIGNDRENPGEAGSLIGNSVKKIASLFLYNGYLSRFKHSI